MTQTLRRELKMKFLEVLSNHLDEVIIPEANADKMLDALADAALSVSGIANSPAARKFSDPYWNLLHGVEGSEDGFDWAAVYKSIAERLEKGLRRNEFPQSNDAQKIYRWIYEQEKKGQNLDKWIKWAMDGKRAEFSYIYHVTPSHIKRDWPQVFSDTPKASSGRKFERLNNG